MVDRVRIPATGQPAEGLLTDLAAMKTGDADYKGGRTFSLVYYVDDAHHEMLQRAAGMFLAENGLNPMAFQSLRRLEGEVVQMTASMLNAPDTAAGTLTSGGTESILLAIKTYRDRARRKWPWIRSPKIVIPATAHPAFDKAGHLFDVRLDPVPVDANGAVDVAKLRRRIDRNTIALVASAPQYPHGTIDPIAEIGALAEKHNLPLHVDACFGGFVLPWLERLGVPMPVWDFRVPGVTSMSADVHKYGYAPKGASVILYRDRGLLRHQFYVKTGWVGGIYASPSLPGSRPGAPIATAWASMRSLGEAGYLDLAKKAWEASERLRAAVRGTPGLKLLGQPHSTVVTWASDDPAVDVYAMADQLAAKGWHVDRQQDPPSVHCSMNATNLPSLDEYVRDLRAAVDYVRAHPEAATSGEAAMYGMMAKIPVGMVVREAVLDVLEDLYSPKETSEGKKDGPPPWMGKALGTIHQVEAWWQGR